MTSWRATTPEPVQNTFDELFGIALDAAVELLTKRKEFFPFGLEASGDQAALVAADPGLGERPDSQSVLADLYTGSRARRSDIGAVAFVCDVRLQSGSDAIRVDLEHPDGHALRILAPYRLKRFGRSVELGEMAVSEGERRIWD